jgi:beta-mannosidase
MYAQSLDGRWELRRIGAAERYAARVPGSVQLDLLRARVIPDPFVADNEYRDSWVYESDWTYSRSLRVEAALAASERVELVFEGLDTLAEVRLDGRLLGRADNMFRSWRFDVTGRLRAGRSHRLDVHLPSTMQGARRRQARDPLQLGPESEAGGTQLRKSASQFGWDWGPRLPPVGIWRSVRLEGRDHARLCDLQVRQRHARDGRVSLSVRVDVRRWLRAPLELRLRVKGPGGFRFERKTRLPEGKNSHRTQVPIPAPRLWWPNGLGQQPRYRLQLDLLADGHSVDQRVHQLGLRRLRLRRRKDRFGESFYFEVNGLPLFARGANWIPADSFPTRLSAERYRDLVDSAAWAGMNMLRVWGGGFYEDEAFYEACDERGILVWQDFMFACGTYPGDRAFEKNVEAEARENVRRLRHRPCLALWCGNNEMEWGWEAWGWSRRRTARQEQAAYRRMFHRILPRVVAEEDPDTAYWPSSPSSNTPFREVNAEQRGDGHDWMVWHGQRAFTDYRRRYFRFMSEFGFQSLPSYETVKAFAAPADRNMTSYVMECHQKNAAANGKILHYLAGTFRFPNDFRDLCLVSQLLQAEAIRYGVEHWRRQRNHERCMGTLYWQLNDCWPVASWSSVDYFHRWKALHYAARRFNAAVLLSVCEDAERGSVELHLTNDLPHSVSRELRWSLERLDGAVLRHGKKRVRAPGCQDVCVARLDFSGDLADPTTRHSTVLVTELREGRRLVARQVTGFVPPKHQELRDPGLQLRVSEDGRSLKITATRSLARFVWLAGPREEARFSDNAFDLPKGRSVRVRTLSEGKLRRRDLVLRSLYDTFA